MESLTIGTLVASALAMGAEAALKGVVGEAAKEAYNLLKSKVTGWAGGDVETLEKAPSSAGRRTVVAEAIDARPVDEQAASRDLAERLVALLKEAGAVGLDVGRLDALAVDLGSIKVTQGTGVHIGDARVLGTFKTGDIDVGGPPTKKGSS